MLYGGTSGRCDYIEIRPQERSAICPYKVIGGSPRARKEGAGDGWWWLEMDSSRIRMETCGKPWRIGIYSIPAHGHTVLEKH